MLLRRMFRSSFRDAARSRKARGRRPTHDAAAEVQRLEDRVLLSAVEVTPGALDGWTPTESGTADVSFVAGPETPPLGEGSAQLSVGAAGGSAAQLRNGDYDGVLLSDITSLSYFTYVQQDGSGGQAPYLILDVDLDGDGTMDDLLFFEPVYQTGDYVGDPVPDQGDVTVGDGRSGTPAPAAGGR